MKAGEAIESGMLTRQIEKAQRKVEAHNFDIRKQLLLFDDVANDQRKVIYSSAPRSWAPTTCRRRSAGSWRTRSGRSSISFCRSRRCLRTGICRDLPTRCSSDFGARIDPRAWLAAEPELEEQKLRERVVQTVLETYDAKVARVGAPIMRHIEKQTMLQKLDQHWREHLARDGLPAQGIHLRGYAQKNYRYEFKREAFELFAAMLERVKLETASFMATCRGPHPGGARA